jgi:hypothetical protein
MPRRFLSKMHIGFGCIFAMGVEGRAKGELNRISEFLFGDG